MSLLFLARRSAAADSESREYIKWVSFRTIHPLSSCPVHRSVQYSSSQLGTWLSIRWESYGWRMLLRDSWVRIGSRPRADRAHCFARERAYMHDPTVGIYFLARTWPIKAHRLSFHGGRNVPVARDLALRSEAEYIRETIRRVPLGNRSPSYKYEREGIKLIKVNTSYLEGGLLSMTGGSLRSLRTRPRRVTILIFAKEDYKKETHQVICTCWEWKTSRVHSLT